MALSSHCPQVVVVPPPCEGSCDQADGSGPRGQTQESGNNRPTQGGVVALPSFPAFSLCTEFGERPDGCWTPTRTSSANSKVRGGEVRPTSCLGFVCALEPRYASQPQMCLLTSGASLRGRPGTDTMFQLVNYSVFFSMPPPAAKARGNTAKKYIYLVPPPAAMARGYS